MNISSLSLQSKKRLSELLEDLTDILNRKDSLMENASKEINRMNTINDMQSKLDAKGSEITSIKTPIDAKELQELVEKSDKLSTEKEEINIKSKKLNDDLEELVNIENSIMNDINEILYSNNSKEEDKGIYVDSLNTKVNIIDASIPEDKDMILKENCEIINCSINLIAEISKIYRSNITDIIIEELEDDNFDKLKEKVEKYKDEKNSSYDKQLELLKKSFEETPEEKIVIEQPQETNNEQINEVENNVVIEPEVKQEEVIEEPINININNENVEPIKTEESENIVPLSTVLEVNEPVANQDNIQNDLGSIIYINSEDKVVPNQIARATKDKLYNKIIKIFEGSYPETKFNVLNKVDNNIPFNIDNFVSNKTA